jgi:hypothetical protein
MAIDNLEKEQKEFVILRRYRDLPEAVVKSILDFSGRSRESSLIGRGTRLGQIQIVVWAALSSRFHQNKPSQLFQVCSKMLVRRPVRVAG